MSHRCPVPFALWQLESARCICWQYDLECDQVVVVCEVIGAGRSGELVVARLLFDGVRRFERRPGSHKPSQRFQVACSLREVMLSIEHVTLSTTATGGRFELDLGVSFGGLHFDFEKLGVEQRTLTVVTTRGDSHLTDSDTGERVDFFDPFGASDVCEPPARARAQRGWHDWDDDDIAAELAPWPTKEAGE